MMHHPPAGRDALIAYVMGLAVACPVDQDNPSDCPLHMLRQKAMRDRLAWVKSLANEDLRKIATTHCACLEKKVAQQY